MEEQDWLKILINADCPYSIQSNYRKKYVPLKGASDLHIWNDIIPKPKFFMMGKE
jgi:hypothetical protein